MIALNLYLFGFSKPKNKKKIDKHWEYWNIINEIKFTNLVLRIVLLKKNVFVKFHGNILELSEKSALKNKLLKSSLPVLF